MKILFLASNPQSTSRLNLGKEAREIEDGLRRSKLANQFQFIQRWAVRHSDLRRALLEENPDIVHFSGHGKGEKGLVLENEAEQAKPATGEALAELFSLFPSIKCVLLNACYAEIQAKSIVKHIDYVVGMKHVVLDKSAIVFATGFYDGLGYGRTIDDAFKLGCSAILFEFSSFSVPNRKLIPVDLEKIESQVTLSEYLKPILLKKAFKVTQDITLPINEIIQNSSTSVTYKKTIQEYRDRVKEYLADRVLTSIEQFQLAILAKQLGISELEANNILQTELRKIEEFNQSQPNTATIKIEKFLFETISVDGNGEENSRTTREAKFFSEDLGNGVALEMVRIPHGQFLMGSSQDLGWNRIRNDVFSLIDEIFEQPQHRVKVPSFWMGKYQVTQMQWRIVASFPKFNCELHPDPSKYKGNNRPVENISWNDAVEFCSRLSRYTGRSYRLPSEAEWEFACRAGTTTSYHFGSKLTPKLARCRPNVGEHFLGLVGVGNKTIEVGQFFANDFGLYDMHGNVLEWCEDDWHSNYNGAPEDGTAWLSGLSNRKVVRGGCWNSIPLDCRSAYRGVDLLADYWLNDAGLRIVCTT